LVATMTAGVVSKPVPKNRLDMARRTDSHSFNHWGGFSSLDGFDNFYGSGNFDGSQHSSQTIVNEKHLVCHTQRIEVIQQRLVVLQEMVKRIITEQICEVETQTIVFEQFHSSLGGFSHDLRRSSGHQVGYDSNIVSHYGSLVHSDGSLNVDDWGFSGHDVGSHTVVVGGSNWVDSSSPVSVNNAYNAAHDASVSLHPEISSASPSTTIVPSNVAPSDPTPSDVVPSNAPAADANTSNIDPTTGANLDPATAP